MKILIKTKINLPTIIMKEKQMLITLKTLMNMKINTSIIIK